MAVPKKIVLFVASALVAICSAASKTNMDRVWLNSTLQQPKCIDGTSAAMYVDKGSAKGKYIVWIQGGGLCQSLDDCKDRAQGDLGSSKNYAAQIQTGDGMLLNDPVQNPDFHEWTRIFVPYCSGDVWDGTAKLAMNPFPQKSDDDDWVGYFQGHTIVEAVLNATRDQFGLESATDVILTGCSAGGIGTFFNCDYTAEYMKDLAPTAKVACRPEAGYFGLPIASYNDFPKLSADPRHLAGSNWTINVDPYTSKSAAGQACILAVTSGARTIDHCDDQKIGPSACCGQVPILYDYIKTPIFVSENTADSYQVFTQGACPNQRIPKVVAYVEYLRNILATSLINNVEKGVKQHQDGMFAPACLRHCMLWTEDTANINGRSHHQAFGDWYFQRNSMNMSLNNGKSEKLLLSCTDHK